MWLFGCFIGVCNYRKFSLVCVVSWFDTPRGLPYLLWAIELVGSVGLRRLGVVCVLEPHDEMRGRVVVKTRHNLHFYMHLYLAQVAHRAFAQQATLLGWWLASPLSVLH